MHRGDNGSGGVGGDGTRPFQPVAVSVPDSDVVVQRWSSPGDSFQTRPWVCPVGSSV